MAIELLAEGPLTLGGPLVLRPPTLSAVVIGVGISFTPGQYSEPVELSWRLFRDGTYVGDEGYVPVVSDDRRRFVLIETARGSRGLTQQVSGQVGITDVAIVQLSPLVLRETIIPGDLVQDIVAARGRYTHPSGILMRRLTFHASGVEVPGDYAVQGDDEIEVFETVESSSGVLETFAAPAFVVTPLVGVVTYLDEAVTYLGQPVTYAAP
jgi:hypothetical protein